jgi:multidrug efflux pump subunit AcrA (membrane-fusion protein)
MGTQRFKTVCRLGACLFATAAICACGNKTADNIPTGKVTKGTFFVDLYEEGEIEAVNSITISSPNVSWRYNLKINEIIKDGTEVSPGDTVIVFDPADFDKDILDAQSRLEIENAELERMKAQQESDLEELRATYEVTRLSLEISKIQFDQAAYESEIRKKEIQLNLDKAEISLQKAKEEIDNRIKLNTEDIKQKNLSMEQDITRLKVAQESLEKLWVVSPASGIAIIERNWSSGNKYQAGDQTYPVYPLITLPDLSKLKAIVNINEVDIAKITKGLDVEIKPDAFSETTFTGKVLSVANLAVNKEGSNKIKVFPVEVFINETHKNLLPGLTVSCRILIEKLEDVLYLPSDAVFAEGDTYFVYRKTGGGYNKTEVKTGASNSDYTVVTEGLDENDVVALVDPFVEEDTKTEGTDAQSN